MQTLSFEERARDHLQLIADIERLSAGWGAGKPRSVGVYHVLTEQRRAVKRMMQISVLIQALRTSRDILAPKKRPTTASNSY